MKVLYEAETEALKFYGGSKNIIMNFCSYSQKSLSSDREYHMVLEFGERDLDEYSTKQIDRHQSLSRKFAGSGGTFLLSPAL